jgi:hypothetical protein
VPRLPDSLDDAELVHGLGRDEEREALPLLRDVDADLGRPGDEDRLGMRGPELEELGARRKRAPALSESSVSSVGKRAAASCAVKRSCGARLLHASSMASRIGR